MKSESSSSGRSSRTSTVKPKRSPIKFIPNLTQLSDATKDLPDAELWPDDTYACPIEVNGGQKTIEFKRKQITRGSERPYRWIYKGKVLIRNRDIPEN
jgi:hypothetical protein